MRSIFLFTGILLCWIPDINAQSAEWAEPLPFPDTMLNSIDAGAASTHPNLFINASELRDLNSRLIKGNKPALQGQYERIKVLANQPLSYPPGNGSHPAFSMTSSTGVSYFVQKYNMVYCRASKNEPVNVYAFDNVILRQFLGENNPRLQARAWVYALSTDATMKARLLSEIFNYLTAVDHQVFDQYTKIRDVGDILGANAYYQNVTDCQRADVLMSLNMGLLTAGPLMTALSHTFDLVYSGTTLAQKNLVSDMLRKMIKMVSTSNASLVKNFPSIYARGGNHVSVHLAALISGAAVSGRRLFLDRLINGDPIAMPGMANWKQFLADSVLNGSEYLPSIAPFVCNTSYVPTPYNIFSLASIVRGEILDRHRHCDPTRHDAGGGLGYSAMSLHHQMIGAEAAFRQGYDLFRYSAPTGENLLLPAVYQAQFQKFYFRPFSDSSGRHVPYLKPEGPVVNGTWRPLLNGEERYVYEKLSAQAYNLFDILGMRYNNSESLIANAFYRNVNAMTLMPVDRQYIYAFMPFFGKTHTGAGDKPKVDVTKGAG